MNIGEKINNHRVLQWILYKLAAIALILVAAGIIYSVIFLGALYEVRSLIRQGDIILFERGSLAIVGGVPIFIYLFFFSLRTLFSKGLLAPRKQTRIGFVFMIFSIIIFVISYIAMWIVPFAMMASPYTHCHQEKLSGYYVLDPQRCETITPQYWPSIFDE